MCSKKRIGKFSEGSKGPFASDIVSRIWITLYHLARRKTGMSLDDIRVELNTYFSDYFGKRTLNNVSSDKFRRTLLVDRMVDRIGEIRTSVKRKHRFGIELRPDARRSLMISERSLTQLRSETCHNETT
jgi:hypothetical protein